MRTVTSLRGRGRETVPEQAEGLVQCWRGGSPEAADMESPECRQDLDHLSPERLPDKTRDALRPRRHRCACVSVNRRLLALIGQSVDRT